METPQKIWFFFKFEIVFWLVQKSWNYLSFVNISPTLVIITSMEGLHEYYTMELIGVIILSINIQVGLNMHLYDDIGDASSSLRGLTSSLMT